MARLASAFAVARKPPSFGLGAFVVVACVGAVLSATSAHASPHPTANHTHASPHAHTAENTPAHKKLSLPERLHQAEHDLHHAQNEHDAQRAWHRAELLRQRSLSAGVQLIVKDALDLAQKGDVEHAEHKLSAALTLQPDNAFLRRQRAGIRLLGNDPTGAVQDIGVSLNTDPRDPTAWMLLAEAQEKLHHNDLALHAFEEAMSCTPYLPDKEKKQAHYTQLAHGHED